jgi:choline dehydrogenase-like flavoprotein
VSDAAPATRLDYDWVVVGSGFGGSVAALRLAEKGYRVGVLECGSRYRDEDYAKSAWNLRRYFWMPKLGMRGVFRMTVFKDVFIVSGSGVGGGSLGYANTLYRARPEFFNDNQWAGLADWDSELGPHYETAERMLGVTTYEGLGPPTSCSANTEARSGSRTRSSPPGSEPSSASPAWRWTIRTSAVRARDAPAASAAAAA